MRLMQKGTPILEVDIVLVDKDFNSLDDLDKIWAEYPHDIHLAAMTSEAYQKFEKLLEPSAGQIVEESKPTRTDGKRAIRTKDTGDNVYLIDDIAKTKAWVTATKPETGPDTLRKLGFEMSDVQEVESRSLIGYQQMRAIYKVD
jgi:hypothetical protein